MGDRYLLNELITKRTELAGRIEHAQAELSRMVRDLESIDATIRIFDEDYQAAAIEPAAFRPPDNWANRGEMTRIVLDVLRQATTPLTTGDIAVALMKSRALDADNINLKRLMIKRVGVALRGQRNQGRVRSKQGPGQYMVWEIARTTQC